MSTTNAAEALTPKQKQVFDLLEQGLTPPAISKKLKISTSGVYGHMRHIRSAGITLPSEQLSGNGAETKVTPPAVPSNGAPAEHIDVEAVVTNAIKMAKGQLDEIDGVIRDSENRIEQATKEKERVALRIEKLDKAQAALA